MNHVIDPTKRAFSYDVNGQLAEERRLGVSDTVLTYTHDPSGRLTRVERRQPPRDDHGPIAKQK